jgi:hypothetical protein
MLITISLGIMVLLTLFSVVAGSNWNELSSEGLSSSATSLGSEYAFQIDELTGAIAIIVIIVSIATLVGIRVVGSGLSDQSIKTITIGITYIGIWALFSVFSMPLIIMIEVFGTFLYIFLTIMYTIGVVQKITGGTIE